MKKLALFSVLCAYASFGGAVDLFNVPPCNGRRISGVEHAAGMQADWDRSCYAFGMKLLRRATGHDRGLQEAEGIFETLLRLRPDRAFAFIGYAELKIRKRELGLKTDPVFAIHDEAERATRFKPVVPDAFVTLGRADLLIGCLPCAERSANKAEALGASSLELRILQSWIAELRGDRDGARRWLTDALALNPDDMHAKAAVHLALAAFHTRSQELSETDREFRKAIKATPGSAGPYVRRAEFLLRMRGDAGAALEAAANANSVAVTPEAKRLASMAEYLLWAREYLRGGGKRDIKRIVQLSFVEPEEAFVGSARHATLSEICEAMLKAGIVRSTEVRDGDGNTALIAAGAGRNSRIARILLSLGANANAKNHNGERALSFFIRNGDRETAMMLLEAGVEIGYVDYDGSSPLSLAVQSRDAVIVAELLRRKAGASMSGGWSDGDLLAAAATTDDVATAAALLDSGVKVEARDRHGRPPIVTAVFWGSKAVVKLFLERGASPDPAMGVAHEAGNAEILEMLRMARRTPI